MAAATCCRPERVSKAAASSGTIVPAALCSNCCRKPALLDAMLCLAGFPTEASPPSCLPLPSPTAAGSYNQIMLKSPVLLESELDAVRGDSALQAQTFSLHYKAGQPNAMKDALAALCKQVGGCCSALLRNGEVRGRQGWWEPLHMPLAAARSTRQPA